MFAKVLEIFKVAEWFVLSSLCFKGYLYFYVLWVFVCMCVTHVCSAQEGHKKASDVTELEL